MIEAIAVTWGSRLQLGFSAHCAAGTTGGRESRFGQDLETLAQTKQIATEAVGIEAVKTNFAAYQCHVTASLKRSKRCGRCCRGSSKPA